LQNHRRHGQLSQDEQKSVLVAGRGGVRVVGLERGSRLVEPPGAQEFDSVARVAWSASESADALRSYGVR
jgi:hypothetical protein